MWIMKGVVWPKKPTAWIVNRVLFVSVPFTWDTPNVREQLKNRSMLWDRAIVGGSGVYLRPAGIEKIPWVSIQHTLPDALQRVNPRATRTTYGCVNRCAFCGVPHTEGRLKELPDWPDLPILIDSNLLAASESHIDRVMDRLERHVGAEFNQGLDVRLMNEHHAERLSRLQKPIIRLALDNSALKDQWQRAFELLRAHGVVLRSIRSYVLCGFDSGPDDAWDRCEFIESFGVKPQPAWYHELDAIRVNETTYHHEQHGWNDYERRRIMQWFYRRKKAKP
jgi:hypothetical protein